jgi:hypothetical protein
VEPGALPAFFDRLTRQVWSDLALDDRPAARYVADLLTRFARTDALRGLHVAAGRRLDAVADALLEIQRAWEWDSSAFDPGRERLLRRHLGDYTLFMTGIFRDHVERLAMIGYYQLEGRRAYRFVSETARASGEPEASLFRRLADRFEQYAGALAYMRSVHFGHDDPFRPLAAG